MEELLLGPDELFCGEECIEEGELVSNLLQMILGIVESCHRPPETPVGVFRDRAEYSVVTGDLGLWGKLIVTLLIL